MAKSRHLEPNKKNFRNLKLGDAFVYSDGMIYIKLSPCRMVNIIKNINLRSPNIEVIDMGWNLMKHGVKGTRKVEYMEKLWKANKAKESIQKLKR